MHGIGKGENIDIVLNATREDTFTKVRSRGKKERNERKNRVILCLLKWETLFLFG